MKHAECVCFVLQALGEKAVRAVAPGATIVRPADVFGAEDRFLNLFAKMYQVGRCCGVLARD